MGELTPSDVKRWALDAIQKVFETANGRANTLHTLQRLGEDLQRVHNVLADWQGEAGEAFRADLGKPRRDIEADGQESRQVAAAVSRAEGDVRACKRELDDIERAADANGWTITPEWRIDVGDTWIGRDPLEFAVQRQLLQDQLIALKVHAHNADHELAVAVRGAVGEGPLDASGYPLGGGPPAQGVPKPAGGGQPRSLEDMLLPAGAADPGPGDGLPSGAPNPAGGAGGKPPSLQGLLLPTGKQPTSGQGDQPAPGSLPDLLGRLHQPGVPGVPPPQLKPAEVQSFKAMARQTMIRDGAPPDQIEARLNDMVGRTQQWVDNGMPNYVPPEPQPSPPPGFGVGFGDRWRATEQGIKNLIGQGGPGAPGVLESWQQMLKGTVETAQNPIGAAAGEIKNAVDSPSLAYYLGGKASDGAFALPGMLFGGEGAAVEAGLGDIGPGVLDTGPAVSPHAPIGFDHPPPTIPGQTRRRLTSITRRCTEDAQQISANKPLTCRRTTLVTTQTESSSASSTATRVATSAKPEATAGSTSIPATQPGMPLPTGLAGLEPKISRGKSTNSSSAARWKAMSVVSNTCSIATSILRWKT